jgi:glycerol kinase
VAYILALDEGTTSARAIGFDGDGVAHAVAQREIRQIYPQAGWVEHDPREIWTAQSAVAAEALALAGLGSRDVAAIGITNQRETSILWDRDSGEPVCHAIVWQDRRTAPACDQLRLDGREAMIQERTGLLPDAYFSGTKIAWMLDHVAGARARAEEGKLAFGTVDTWLVWKLTDGRLHVTDASNASRTMLFDIHAGRWDDELLRLLRIPGASCPSGPPAGPRRGGAEPALAAFRWRGSRETSRPRCSARCASRPASPRTPLEPDASCFRARARAR